MRGSVACRSSRRSQSWLRSAEHDRIARLLEKEISRIPGVKVVWKVEANGVFVQLPRHSIEKIKQHYFFHFPGQ